MIELQIQHCEFKSLVLKIYKNTIIKIVLLYPFNSVTFEIILPRITPSVKDSIA